MSTTKITLDGVGAILSSVNPPTIIVDDVPWGPLPAAPATTNSLARILYSMKSPHEGSPHGVPVGWSWQQNPSLQDKTPPAGMTAMIPWGQVYTDSYNTHPADSRIAVRGMSAFALLKSTNKWIPLVLPNTIEGAHFNEDFMGNGSVDWSSRIEASDGSTSFDMVDHFNAHFYPTRRALLPLPTSDIAGIFTTVQARIIETVVGGVNDTAQAKWILNMGADWWRDLSVPFVGDFSNNPGVGQGRFMYLTPNWQAFNFYSVTDAQMTSSTPPLK